MRAGFEDVRVSTSSSTVGLAGSLQYLLAGRCLFPGGLRLRLAGATCVLSVPLVWALDRLGGGGDMLHAVARRGADPRWPETPPVTSPAASGPPAEAR